MPHPSIGVGLGVCIVKKNQVLFGKRKGAHDAGTWNLPGGHLKFGETWEECARRETKEETGLEIKNIRFATATEDFFKKENKHYVTIYMLADWAAGEAQIMEPDKCEGWQWRDWHNPPEPLFESDKNLYQQNFNPFSHA